MLPDPGPQIASGFMIPRTKLLSPLLSVACALGSTALPAAAQSVASNHVLLEDFVRRAVDLLPGQMLPEFSLSAGSPAFDLLEGLFEGLGTVPGLTPPGGWCGAGLTGMVACDGVPPLSEVVDQSDGFPCSTFLPPGDAYDTVEALATATQPAGTIALYVAFYNYSDGTGPYTFPVSLPGSFTGFAPYRFCEAQPNSVGTGALIDSMGTPCQSANDLVLLASPVPDQLGLFFLASELLPQAQPFGEGLRCASGQVVRLPIEQAVGGVLAHDIDLAALHIGSTWYAQAWYRDPAGGGAGFNLSDGVTLYVFP